MASLVLVLMTLPIRAEEIPDIDMLEYLGSFETTNGEYIDPQILQGEDVAGAKPQNEAPQEKVKDE